MTRKRTSAKKGVDSLTEAEIDAIADRVLKYHEPYGSPLPEGESSFEVTAKDVDALTERVAERLARRCGLQGLSFLVLQRMRGGGPAPKTVPGKKTRR